MARRHTDSAFETLIGTHLKGNGYVCVPPGAFDRDRAIFPAAVLDLIRQFIHSAAVTGKIDVREEVA